MTETEIGATLKRLRTEADKTQEQLAKLLDWPLFRVQRLEQGRQRLLLSEAITISKVLECELRDFGGAQ